MVIDKRLSPCLRLLLELEVVCYVVTLTIESSIHVKHSSRLVKFLRTEQKPRTLRHEIEAYNTHYCKANSRDLDVSPLFADPIEIATNSQIGKSFAYELQAAH